MPIEFLLGRITEKYWGGGGGGSAMVDSELRSWFKGLLLTEFILWCVDHSPRLGRCRPANSAKCFWEPVFFAKKFLGIWDHIV